MGRMYSVNFVGVSVAAAQDLFEVTAAAGKPLAIRFIEIAQSSDVGDAAEEGLSVTIKTGATSSGSGGSAFTPVPLNINDAAAGFAAEINNTTPASGGTIVVKWATSWNVRTPCIFLPTPECGPVVAGGERCVVSLGAPADALTMSATLFVEELA